MKDKFNTLVRTIGIHVFGTALLVAIVALVPAQAQKKSKYWGGQVYGNPIGRGKRVEYIGPPQRDNYYRRNHRQYNDYRKSLRRDLKRHQLFERRRLHDQQKFERRTYGNNHELREQRREERRALNRHQVQEKKTLKSDLKIIRKRGY